MPAASPADTSALRKARGAFFTPADITEFIAAWAVRSPDDRVLEPSAGDAAFLLSAHRRLTALDPARTSMVDPVFTQDGGEPRLTLPLSRLIEAACVILHIEGEEKRTVLDAALIPGQAKPISAVFTTSAKPVPVYWAR